MKKFTLLFLLFLTVSIAKAQVVLTEDFEAGLTAPPGWTVEDLSSPLSGEVWTFETGGTAGGFTSPNTLVYDNGGDGNYATFDSDGYGNNGTAEESTLTSPAFDCSTLTSVTLSFATVYNGNYGGLGEIEVFNGTTWTNIHTYATATGGTPNTTVAGWQTFDVPELIGVSNAQIRFRWTGNWSISWSIDNISVYQCTAAIPVAASAVAPANAATGVEIGYGATTNSIGPFDWTDVPGADSYNLSFGTNIAGDNIGGIAGATNGNSVNYGGWAPNTTYYWFVESVNCAGTTASPVFSFTTQACTAIAAPAAASAPVPADAAIDVALTASDYGMSFSWTGGSPDDSYSLVLGTVNPPTQTFNNFENGGTITGLAENTTYYWRIVSGNCVGTTDGPVWSFTTGLALSVDEFESLKLKHYYNADSGSLTIKGETALGTIELYNILGQQVLTKNSTHSEESIDMSNLKDGLYIIKISTGNRTQTIKVVKH